MEIIKATAEWIIGQTIVQNQTEINNWLKNPNSSDVKGFQYSGNITIGRGINQGDTAVTDRSNAITVLKKDGNGGFTILTSYPK